MVVLVLLGYIGGFYHHRYVVTQRLQHVAKSMPGAPGMEEHFFELIKATPAQREKIRPIFQKHLQELSVLNLELRERKRPILQSMKAEIDPLLEAHQKEKLEGFISRMNRFPRHRNGKRSKKNHYKGKNVKEPMSN